MCLLQLNVEGPTTAKINITEHLVNNVTVILLQETHSKDNTPLKIADKHGKCLSDYPVDAPGQNIVLLKQTSLAHCLSNPEKWSLSWRRLEPRWVNTVYVQQSSLLWNSAGADDDLSQWFSNFFKISTLRSQKIFSITCGPLFLSINFYAK